MDSPTTIASALATAFLGGDFDVDGLVDRGSRVLGRRWRWLRPLARRLAEAFAGRPRPRQITVTDFILSDDGFQRACRKHDLWAVDLLSASSTMCPVDAARSWNVPSIRTAGELADWLSVTMGELQWFADRRAIEAKQSQGRLRHYHYRPLTKRFGHVRLIEAPKPRLKEIQRQILNGILDHVPPHAAVHGFRRGRSIKTFASPHVGKRVVLRIDLQDFFPSISVARIEALFRAVGYPEPVADLLAGLCTNTTPMDVWGPCIIRTTDWRKRQTRYVYSRPHLPQGAPTSPALANLCAYRMDCRLSGLANSAGAVYTRYADDLAFSGDHDFERAAKRFQLHVCATAMEERFSPHYRKTRIMWQGVRQRLAGIVVNERLNVSRDDFDRLKATLTNCVRLGPQSQNGSGHDDFRAHLDGRISFVEMVNSCRGRRLRELFENVRW